MVERGTERARGFNDGTCLWKLRIGGSCMVQACCSNRSLGRGDGFELMELSVKEPHDVLGVKHPPAEHSLSTSITND